MPSVAPTNWVTSPPHCKTRLKVKNPSYFLKIEKLNWERGRKHVLADGSAERKEV